MSKKSLASQSLEDCEVRYWATDYLSMNTKKRDEPESMG